MKIAGSINLSLCSEIGGCRMGLEKNCPTPYMSALNAGHNVLLITSGYGILSRPTVL